MDRSANSDKDVMVGVIECSNHGAGAVTVAAEEEQRILCFDDIACKELHGPVVRQARALKFKCLRDVHVSEKSRTTSLSSRRGGLTHIAFEGDALQVTSRIVAREFKSGDRSHLFEGTPRRAALQAIFRLRRR